MTIDLSRTQAVLARVLNERRAQEVRYGHVNPKLVSGTGSETRWLGPYTGDSAEQIQKVLRRDYEGWEDENEMPTWAHLVREEIAEAFQEEDPERLAEELVQVAALCVSWVERLESPTRRVEEDACGCNETPHHAPGGCTRRVARV